MDMDTATYGRSIILLVVSGVLILSCNCANLSRTKRTVELIEGAKDFILRLAEINATPGRLVWVQINDENYKGYSTEGCQKCEMYKLIFRDFSQMFSYQRRGKPSL